MYFGIDWGSIIYIDKKPGKGWYFHVTRLTDPSHSNAR